jgi:hypothetical protein
VSSTFDDAVLDAWWAVHGNGPRFQQAAGNPFDNAVYSIRNILAQQKAGNDLGYVFSDDELAAVAADEATYAQNDAYAKLHGGFVPSNDPNPGHIADALPAIQAEAEQERQDQAAADAAAAAAAAAATSGGTLTDLDGNELVSGVPNRVLGVAVAVGIILLATHKKRKP